MIENLKSVTKDSAYYSIANLMNKIVGFILLPLYTTYFSVGEYGILALFDTIVDFMNIFSAFGIVEALKRWNKQKEATGDPREVFSNVFYFSVLSAFMFSILLFLVLKKFSTLIFNSEFSNRFILIYILSIITNIILHRVFIQLRSQRLAKANMKFTIIRMSITCIANVILIVYLKMGIESVFLAKLIGNVFTLVLLLPMIIKNLVLRMNFPLLGEMLKFSLPLAVSSSISLIFTFSDRWLLKGLTTLSDVGQYSLAYKITNLIRFLAVNSFLQAYVYTFFDKMHNQEDYNFFKKIVTYFTFVVMLIGLLLVAFSKELILLLAKDPDYYVSYTIIPILMMAILFSGLRQILVLPFYKYKESKYISLISIIAGVINISLNLIFIPIWQSYGAAAATAAAHLFVVFCLYHKGKKFSEFSYETGRVSVVILTGIAFILMLVWANKLETITSVILKLIIIISYLLVLYLGKFFAPKEIDAFKKVLYRIKRKVIRNE